MTNVSNVVAESCRGRVSRRAFLRVAAAAPLALGVLQACAPAPTAVPPTVPPPTSASSGQAAPAAPKPSSPQPTSPAPSAAGAEFQPTRRGGGGTLKVLFSAGPTLLNPHLAITGAQDNQASRLFVEPLGTYTADGDVLPVLAAEAPSLEKGTLDPGGRWVTWRLKPGVVWHDGQPFTADDVVFTWEYAADPATAAISRGTYGDIETVEKVDDRTVTVRFKEPTPYWHAPFVGFYGGILPKHVMAPFKGQNARSAPFNLRPVGTGPYKVVDFRPGDLITAELNDRYHVPNRPFFDRLELKGGGDATSAARAVLQTGEYDFTYNVQVEKDVLDSLARQSTGRFLFYGGVSTEVLNLNYADPSVEVDGERSSLKTKHPFFGDLKVRQAVAAAVNRKLIVDELYGPAAEVATYLIFNPKKYQPAGGGWDYDLKKAAQLLDEAGWPRGSDGVRARGGVRMKVLYQTTVNSVRQKTQAIIKKDLESIGFEVELKAVPDAVFFATDPGNPDTYYHFYADIQEYSSSLGAPDPQQFAQQFTPQQIPQKANGWAGRNFTRYQNPEMDRLWQAARTEMNVERRTELFRKINQVVLEDVALVPLFHRNGTAAAKATLVVQDLNPWDGVLSRLPYWYRTS